MPVAVPRDDLLALRPSEREALRNELQPDRWVTNIARLRLPKGGEFSFDEHRYLVDVYADMHHDIVVIKGAQMGFSTWAIAKTFWLACTIPCSVVYTFPTSSDVSEFTAARINPVISYSPYLSARIVDKNSVHMKQFRVATAQLLDQWSMLPRNRRPRDPFSRSTVYFGGSATEKDAVAVDADMVVHDEVDLSNPQIIEQFGSRLDHSKLKWRARLSTPRRPGTGVDRDWKTTDQRHWLITCPHCNAEFELAFPGGPWTYSNVEPDNPQDWERMKTARYLCHRCGHTLSPDDRQNGHWVAYEPGAAAHGYQVSQMAGPWVSASQLWAKFANATWKQDFWNLQMGLAWQSETMGFSREALIGNQVDDYGITEPDREREHSYRGEGYVVMGVDPGGAHDWQVQRVDGVDQRRVLGWGTASSWEELSRVVSAFDPNRIVVDAVYDPTKAKEFADSLNRPGRTRVWLCWYGAHPSKGIVWNTELGEVRVDRDLALTDTADEFMEGSVRLPRFDGSDIYERLVSHFVNSQKIPIWVKGLEQMRVLDHYEWHEVGPDHQFHAAAYCHIAAKAPRSTRPPGTGVVTLKRSALAVAQPERRRAAHSR